MSKAPLLADDECKAIALAVVRRTVAALSLRLLAYVIMPDHIHLLVEPAGTCSVSDFMAVFKKRSAWHINKHLARRGPVWRKDFFDHLLRTDEHLEELVRYIHDNPVRRGLVSGADEWEFSSWREMNG